MKITIKSNIMMSLKYLKQLHKTYESLNDKDKAKETMEIINKLKKYYWEV